MKKMTLIFWLICFGLTLKAQEITGRWKTVDDGSGKVKSIVEIYKVGDVYEGKLVKLFLEPGENPNPVCDRCDENDPRFKQPLIGMKIITDMHYNSEDQRLEDGEIMDPENGESYDCEIWLGENGRLNVRGYVLFLYRTQQWIRVSE